MSERTIVLVGLMGSGKSTVGRIVAARLDRELVDSDTAIETKTGSTVRELWERGGEASYRALESEVVLDAIVATQPVVLAAPGGVVLDPAVRAALEVAFVVWLRADPGTLAARVRIGDHRPLLGTDPRTVLSRMAADRADLYREVADVTIDIDGIDAETLAREVLDHYASTAAALTADA
jgi:shikimate kinase